MIRSMTGYGQGESRNNDYRVAVEIKAVNHRYGEVVIRLPRNLVALEEPMRKLILEEVSRGRVDVFCSMEAYGEQPKVVKVDKGLALAYYNAVKDLQGELNLPVDFALSDLLALPDVLKVEEREIDLEEIWSLLQEALRHGLNQFIAMREQEGAKLKQDLWQRVEGLAAMTSAIENRTPLVIEEYRQRLTVMLADLLEQGTLDEGRLNAEVVLYADRSNITEEIVRIKSHLDQLRTALQSSGPVGRKLDFLVQELYREINTIGSKSSDLTIGRNVVEFKSELEKIREQVQNIE